MPAHALTPRTRATACVVALTALALALRLGGIGHELPCDRLGDETWYSDALARFLRGEPMALGYGSTFYPLALPALVGLGSRLVPDGAPSTLAEHLDAASAPLVALRAAVALLATLLVPATYRIARRFLGRPASVLAAGFAATSLLGVWYACQARPHASFAGLATVALAAALAVRRRGDARAWLGAGLACTAAVAALQTGVLLLVPLAVAHLAGRRSRRDAREGAPRRARGALFPALAALAVLLTLRLALPPAFRRFEVHAGDGVTPESGDGFLPIPLVESLDGSGFAAMLRAGLDFDPWLTLLAALGTLAVLARLVPARARLRELASSGRGRDAAVLASFALPLAVVYGVYANTSDRYLLPLVPFAALAAAAVLPAAAALARRALPGLPATAAQAASAALLLAPPAAVALALVSARAEDDTGRVAAAWIERHVERGRERIAVTPSLELPLVRDASGLAWLASFGDRPQPPWIRYQRSLDAATRARLGWPIDALPVQGDARARLEGDPAAYLASTGARWVVVEAASRGPFYARLRAELAARAELALRVSPWRDPADERAFRVSDRLATGSLPGGYAWHALRARSLGPVVEVYRLRGPRD